MKLVRQQGFKDCGPTCLLMIIKYYKGNIHIEKLKDMCATDKSGTSAYHLIEAAKKCGFEANGYKCKLNDLNSENVILPCIAYVILEDTYKHFVVIEKIDFKKRKVYINDPIGKKYILKYNEFEKIYKDILIFLYPIKNVINEKNTTTYKFLYDIIKPSINQNIQLIILSLIITIFSIITSFYMQFMNNNIENSKNKLLFIFLLFILLYSFKIISDFIRNKVVILINKKIDLNLTLTSFKNIIHLPYHCYRNNTTGEIVSRINDLEIIKDFISKVISNMFIDLPLVFVSLIIIYIMNFNLFIVCLIIMLLYILIILTFSKIITNNVSECTDLKAEVTSYMVESINGYDYIKGCNKDKKIINKFTGKYAKMLNKISKFENICNIQILFKQIISDFGFVIAILIGILLVRGNELNLGQLITFNFLFGYTIEPFKNFIDLIITTKHSVISIKKILNLYVEEKNNGVFSYKLKGDIEFKNLTYSFNNIDNVLNNINLTIKESSKVMIIGKSGSGKSTLFKLLKKYYDVERNKIYINNIDINDYKESDVVYVSQNEMLFTDTIINNIGSDINISKICLIDEILKNHPLGYNTLIEENGFNLSGGERQRMILARALSSEFSILIIDEGLSQVDTNMERVILKNLFEKYHNKTIIFISHRLDNMDLFNQVIKIEEGRIISDTRKC